MAKSPLIAVITGGIMLHNRSLDTQRRILAPQDKHGNQSLLLGEKKRAIDSMANADSGAILRDNRLEPGFNLIHEWVGSQEF